MEPRDLHVVQMAPTINPKHGQGISSNHAGGAHAALADGTTRWLSDSLPPETLERLLKKADGEYLDPDAF